MGTWTIEQAMQAAVAHHQAGRLGEAEQIYRQVLAAQPANADALHLLGMIAIQVGRVDVALGLYWQAIRILQSQGRLDDAAGILRKVVAAQPEDAGAHKELGDILSDRGELDEAIVEFRKAIEIDPGSADVFNNLGIALTKSGRLDDAIAAFGQAIRRKPELAEIHHNLASVFKKKGMLDEEREATREALRLNPGDIETRRKLGVMMRYQGLIDETIALYREGLRLNPDSALIHSSLVFTMNYHAGTDSEMLLKESRQWALRHAEPLKKFIAPHENDRSPDRRLRVGFVSKDFRDHVLGANILPIFREYDRSGFEFFCYHNARVADPVTEQFQSLAAGWRKIFNTPGDAVARMIREDRIDILVDLSLHTSANGLLVFARKPAPVQVTWGGYPGTTGLDAIDYRLTDPYLDPPGERDAFYTERSIRLPHSFWCYDPISMGVAEGFPVNDLPAMRNGYVTFGCMNAFAKMNSGVVELWSRVLRALPNSRLIQLVPRGQSQQRLLDQFAMHGIGADRIQFADRQKKEDYLRTFSRMDIGLDTVPYNGHTTTLDALWMGVPMVTLVGNTVAGRGGVSILSNVGFGELVARTTDEFVKIVVELANDLPRAAALRAGLRERMRNSPLTDAAGFTRGMEAAFREMWRAWARS
jgi:protein O-GlcNAc transferase